MFSHLKNKSAVKDNQKIDTVDSQRIDILHSMLDLIK
jgi:hypothetical protein